MGLFPSAESALDDLGKKVANPFKQKVKGVTTKNDYPDGFIIRELLKGGLIGAEVRLSGTNAPHQPFERGAKQRLTAEYYPGNPEPNIQVLGGQEPPVTIRGRFYSKRYREASMYDAPKAYQKALENIAMRGNLCRITLGLWRRFAMLEEAKFREKTRGDVEYELTFTIISASEPRNYHFVSTEKPDPLRENQELLNKTAAFQESYQGVTSIDQSIGDKLNGYISDVAGTISAVTGFVDKAFSTVEGIQNSISRAIGLVRVARASVARFHRRLRLIEFSTLASLGITARYRTISTVKGAASATAGISDVLARLQAQLEAIRKTVPKARHLVRQGDTLQKLAVRYFGNAELWSKIYDHNKLSSTVIAPPQILEIPNV